MDRVTKLELKQKDIKAKLAIEKIREALKAEGHGDRDELLLEASALIEAAR